jgi:hypothetical protein
MSEIEFAGGRRGLGPYDSLAKRSGQPLAYVVQLAAENRLGELFDEHGFVGRPRTPAEALRRLENRRHDPSVRRRSPAALLGELHAMRTIWAIEAEELHRQRDPSWRLGQILAKKTPPWLED